MITNQLYFYVIAGGITLLFVVLALMGYMIYRKTSSKVAYNQQLQDLLGDNDMQVRNVGLVYRWNQYWSKLFHESGWGRYGDEDNSAGRDVFVLGLFAMIIVSIITRVVFLGPIIVGMVGAIVVSLVKFKNQREQQKLNEQLPGFLAALKANIQANTTPERALVKVVDDMPSPLYEDLLPAKRQILANTSFTDVIKDLNERTTSKDLKFLCACMIQAVSTGASLESQIGTIQKVLEERQKVNDEINKAVSSAMPSIYIASLAIPLVFFATYFLNDATRQYWFVDPTSWIGLGVVLALWATGIYLSKKSVDSIRNL